MLAFNSNQINYILYIVTHVHSTTHSDMNTLHLTHPNIRSCGQLVYSGGLVPCPMASMAVDSCFVCVCARILHSVTFCGLLT